MVNGTARVVDTPKLAETGNRGGQEHSHLIERGLEYGLLIFHPDIPMEGGFPGWPYKEMAFYQILLFNGAKLLIVFTRSKRFAMPSLSL